jgi:GDP-mannose 6-dehydrogenase
LVDILNSAKTVIGASHERAANIVSCTRWQHHRFSPDLRTAAMLKYVDNSWRALKATFANEVGRLSKAMRGRW